eukprot:TRINITY_DN4581_c0_g1_i1.p1 TRINITY_DN4581_c0_g1~~TRINITY_DN4581_c0_g1_i1.p1  ORF type:complete len:309 (+),score=55.84 TRINITY_DN4581_c0_g1_i1:225-1151(+)
MAKSVEPPPFQMGMRCEVCNCTFNAFRRRHHCRCCGRTLCSEHSSKQIPLPQFSIYHAVRVCDDCFNGRSQQSSTVTSVSPSNGKIISDNHDMTGSHGISEVADSLEKVDLNGKESPSKSHKLSLLTTPVVSKDFECKCGMPLCICEAPKPPEVQSVASSSKSPQQPPKKASSVSPVTTNARLRSTTSSSEHTRPSLFFETMQMSDMITNKSSKDYETSGEGLREAIKNGDLCTVKELLMKGVDANYCDKQGMSLLHLAAVFNHSDIAFVLMDAGARVDAKNAQGETPLDCAQTMLQYKMREKVLQVS